MMTANSHRIRPEEHDFCEGDNSQLLVMKVSNNDEGVKKTESPGPPEIEKNAGNNVLLHESSLSNNLESVYDAEWCNLDSAPKTPIKTLSHHDSCKSSVRFNSFIERVDYPDVLPEGFREINRATRFSRLAKDDVGKYVWPKADVCFDDRGSSLFNVRPRDGKGRISRSARLIGS